MTAAPHQTGYSLWVDACDPADVDEFYELLERRPAWHAEAACRGSEVDFFPERGVNATLAALEVCRGCTVRSECLAVALRFDDCDGIWGGTTS